MTSAGSWPDVRILAVVLYKRGCEEGGVSYAYFNAMITLGVIIGLFLLAGVWIVWREFRNAPLGEQDEHGFHEVVEGIGRIPSADRVRSGNDGSESASAEVI